MKSEAEWIAILPKIWEVVASDASVRGRYIIRCTACGAEESRSKYQFKNATSCYQCWLFGQVYKHPRVRQRVLAMKSDIEELERLYSLPDPRS